MFERKCSDLHFRKGSWEAGGWERQAREISRVMGEAGEHRSRAKNLRAALFPFMSLLWVTFVLRPGRPTSLDLCNLEASSLGFYPNL